MKDYFLSKKKELILKVLYKIRTHLKNISWLVVLIENDVIPDDVLDKIIMSLKESLWDELSKKDMNLLKKSQKLIQQIQTKELATHSKTELDDVLKQIDDI